jgi:chitinase
MLTKTFLLVSSADPWQDLEDGGGKAGYKRLTDYKKTHRHLKVLLAIGGWNEGSQNYSELAGHPERRQRFVKQSSEFIRRYNFDGKSHSSPTGGKKFIACVCSL